MPLVGFILIAMALFAVGGTLFMVVRENVEHEEWYIPPQPGSTPAVTPTAQPGTTSVPTPAPVAEPAPEPDAKTE
ncbi:MAG: hypothetical protein GC204_00240 [Chloroflexi bacterium]|nr:hypothetical protein [Chloroflexota bacterium]